uniref:Uncharacterized protein n=1 Tax=Anopheles funestus TaxID=62324 RepID=A0A182RMF7_ANOFN
MQRPSQIQTLAEDSALSVEEDACERHTVHNSSGRYVNRLPFNSNPHVVLGGSQIIADRGLRCMKRRLNNNPKMKEEYVKFMVEDKCWDYMKGVIDPADDVTRERRLCRLPRQESFSDEQHDIENGRNVPRNSILKWSSPIIEQWGKLRVGGRLRNAQVTESRLITLSSELL